MSATMAEFSLFLFKIYLADATKREYARKGVMIGNSAKTARREFSTPMTSENTILQKR